MHNIFCIIIIFKICETITWNLKKIWNFKSFYLLNQVPLRDLYIQIEANSYLIKIYVSRKSNLRHI